MAEKRRSSASAMHGARAPGKRGRESARHAGWLGEGGETTGQRAALLVCSAHARALTLRQQHHPLLARLLVEGVQVHHSPAAQREGGHPEVEQRVGQQEGGAADKDGQVSSLAAVHAAGRPWGNGCARRREESLDAQRSTRTALLAGRDKLEEHGMLGELAGQGYPCPPEGGGNWTPGGDRAIGKGHLRQRCHEHAMRCRASTCYLSLRKRRWAPSQKRARVPFVVSLAARTSSFPAGLQSTVNDRSVGDVLEK